MKQFEHVKQIVKSTTKGETWIIAQLWLLNKNKKLTAISLLHVWHWHAWNRTMEKLPTNHNTSIKLGLHAAPTPPEIQSTAWKYHYWHL